MICVFVTLCFCCLALHYFLAFCGFVIRPSYRISCVTSRWLEMALACSKAVWRSCRRVRSRQRRRRDGVGDRRMARNDSGQPGCLPGGLVYAQTTIYSNSHYKRYPNEDIITANTIIINNIAIIIILDMFFFFCLFTFDIFLFAKHMFENLRF